MPFKILNIQDLESLPNGAKFFKINKLKIEFKDNTFKLVDSGLTQAKGLLLCEIEKFNDKYYRITGGNFSTSELRVSKIDGICNDDTILMFDKDELVRVWVDNATDTLKAISNFCNNNSQNAMINIVWASTAVQNSKDNRPELWI